ncbi:hypothetical protein [Paenibacillus sp. Marseille-Q4541]|uniref:hypothetical protein n=1 Tax=Paenibacillus sp. Marseille-Q4541 TaxID=2831522 RepID=UPI001BA9DB64|nr:hypothetical protein [Paenibacillus sp. Marseille-Q4541]
MIDFELTKKRNNHLVFVLATAITVDQMLSFAIGISLQFVLTAMGIIFLVIVPVTLLSNLPKFRRTIPYIKYFLTVVIGGSLFILIQLDPHMINIMTMYFYVAVMGIYQDRKINILTILITLTILCYYFFTQGELIFHSTNVQDLMYYIITFCFVSVANHMHSQFNNSLQEEKDQQAQRAMEAKSAMEDMLTKITESLQSVRQYQYDLNAATDATNQRSIEIVSSIENIIESFEVQNKQSAALASQLNQASEEFNKAVPPFIDFQEQASPSSSTTNNPAVIEQTLMDTRSMLQEIETTAKLTADMTEYNKGSLNDVLRLVSIQQQEITYLCEGFAKLEKQLSRINRKNQS